MVCDTKGGQRAGRANRAPGRCRAGEGVAWRHNLTGRLVSSAYSARRRDSCAALMLPTMRKRRSNPLTESKKAGRNRAGSLMGRFRERLAGRPLAELSWFPERARGCARGCGDELPQGEAAARLRAAKFVSTRPGSTQGNRGAGPVGPLSLQIAVQICPPPPLQRIPLVATNPHCCNELNQALHAPSTVTISAISLRQSRIKEAWRADSDLPASPSGYAQKTPSGPCRLVRQVKVTGSVSWRERAGGRRSGGAGPRGSRPPCPVGAVRLLVLPPDPAGAGASRQTEAAPPSNKGAAAPCSR